MSVALVGLERLETCLCTALTQHKKMGEFASQLRRRIGHLTPDAWTPQRNSRYIRERGSLASARRELQELRSAFLLYNEPGFVPPEVKYPPERPPRDRYITRAQAKRLLEAARPVYHVWLFILLAMTTGRRKGAILDLTWDRVDLERGVLDFSNPELMMTKKRRGASKAAASVIAVLAQATVTNAANPRAARGRIYSLMREKQPSLFKSRREGKRGKGITDQTIERIIRGRLQR